MRFSRLKFSNVAVGTVLLLFASSWSQAEVIEKQGTWIDERYGEVVIDAWPSALNLKWTENSKLTLNGVEKQVAEIKESYPCSFRYDDETGEVLLADLWRGQGGAVPSLIHFSWQGPTPLMGKGLESSKRYRLQLRSTPGQKLSWRWPGQKVGGTFVEGEKGLYRGEIFSSLEHDQVDIPLILSSEKGSRLVGRWDLLSSQKKFQLSLLDGLGPQGNAGYVDFPYVLQNLDFELLSSNPEPSFWTIKTWGALIRDLSKVKSPHLKLVDRYGRWWEL